MVSIDHHWCKLLTTLPRRATLAPAVRTRAKTTLPKLPSPMSLMISNLSSRLMADVAPLDELRCEKSNATVILKLISDVFQFNLSIPRSCSRSCSKVQQVGDGKDPRGNSVVVFLATSLFSIHNDIQRVSPSIFCFPLVAHNDLHWLSPVQYKAVVEEVVGCYEDCSKPATL